MSVCMEQDTEILVSQMIGEGWCIHICIAYSRVILHTGCFSVMETVIITHIHTHIHTHIRAHIHAHINTLKSTHSHIHTHTYILSISQLRRQLSSRAHKAYGNDEIS